MNCIFRPRFLWRVSLSVCFSLSLSLQMEYCEKSTLRDTIDQGLYQDCSRLWRLFREILDGIAYIHEQVTCIWSHSHIQTEGHRIVFDNSAFDAFDTVINCYSETWPEGGWWSNWLISTEMSCCFWGSQPVILGLAVGYHGLHELVLPVSLGNDT